MQEEQEEGEQDPFFYDLPLPRLLTWTRWWHLTAKTIVLVHKKRTWGVIGPYLKSKKKKEEPAISTILVCLASA